MSPCLRAAAALLLSISLMTGATAQVVPVNNTGCPGFAPPQWTGQARIGQTLTFNLLGRPAPRSFVFLLLGYPSGAGMSFTPPMICVPGPCVLYPAPFGGGFIATTDTFNARLPLPIPNDRRLVFQTFSVQGGFFDGLGNCLTLSQAVSFAIGP